jgi:excisionase family DNA binding protein
MFDDKKMLWTKDVAKLLRLSERTIERMRERGDGPPWCKCGRSILYQRSDLDDWLRAAVKNRSHEASS